MTKQRIRHEEAAQGKEIETNKKQQIREKFQRLRQTNDPKLRDEIIMEHLYIAEILAKKYANRGIDYEDLVQVASIGLIYAVDRYDVTKGYEFSSFATPTIVGELKRHFRDKGWVIRVPRRIQELTKKINQARSVLAQELQRQPTVDDIAEYLSLSVEEILEAMEASKVYAPQSLDKTYEQDADEREVQLSDVVGEEDENFAKIDFHDVIEQIYELLNALEKKIFYYRYFDKRTQVSIAQELDLSQMTVSRIEKKIIKKFRDALNLKPEDFKKNRARK